MQKDQGVITFLGDDDLVSPLVAAIAPQWNVHVIDIDVEVLNKADSVAGQLGAKIQVHHNDLASAIADSTLISDIAVGDPFPSGDGSFEGVFWDFAAHILQQPGVLITTVAPSHKPLDYSFGALQKLYDLGFCIKDLQENFGEYEVFNFEFLTYEQQILNAWGLEGNISHTKSLLAAQYNPKANIAIQPKSHSFDYQRWMWSAATHYLTVQANQSDQIRIAGLRGVDSISRQESDSIKGGEGLNVSVIVPRSLRENLEGHYSSTRDYVIDCTHVLVENFHIEPTSAELAELIRISKSANLATSGPLARLGLSIRAIESWERWRFDD
jgi:hypothetical protein